MNRVQYLTETEAERLATLYNLLPGYPAHQSQQDDKAHDTEEEKQEFLSLLPDARCLNLTKPFLIFHKGNSSKLICSLNGCGSNHPQSEQFHGPAIIPSGCSSLQHLAPHCGQFIEILLILCRL